MMHFLYTDGYTVMQVKNAKSFDRCALLCDAVMLSEMEWHYPYDIDW